jgi:DNA-directed RNA polymerase I subunit RPA2
MVPDKDRDVRERRVYPAEVNTFLTECSPSHSIFQARERLTSYRGRMTIKLCWTDTEGNVHSIPKDCGLVPIMVRVRWPLPL